MDSESRIDQLKKKLYAKGKQAESQSRSTLREKQHAIPNTWNTEKSTEEAAPGQLDAEENWYFDTMGKKHKKTADTFFSLKWILIISSIFFVAAAGVAAYVFLGGSGFVSARNVEIQVAGPTAVNGGEELSLQVTVTNNNSTALELATLIVEYPDGTRAPGNLSRELPREAVNLGTVAPGEQVTETVRSIIFGQEGSQQEIQLSVEYRIADSNAIFSTDSAYQVGISSAPISVSVTGIEEVSAGQEVELTMEVNSNAESVIEDVLLEAEYPFGFRYEEANPEPTYGDNRWVLGDLPAGSSRTITLRGTMVGQEAEERVFRFAAGVQREDDPRELAAAFITNEHAVTVRRPFVSLDLALNGDTAPTFIAQNGQRIRGDVTWENTTAERVFDAEIVLSLDGVALDPRSVSVDRGFYSSANNTITWSRDSVPALAELDPGARGSMSFTFMPRSAGAQNPEIQIEASVDARRVSENQQVPQRVEGVISRNVKVATDLSLTSRAVYFAGPFNNSGPLPPSANTETTYTILWTATNATNAVTDGMVTATLPSYVTWKSVINPQNANISYNPVGGTITWTVGEITPGMQKEVAFQIGLTPSISQVGQEPVIVNTQTISGLDRFIEREVSRQFPSLTTRLSTDSQVEVEDARVVE